MTTNTEAPTTESLLESAAVEIERLAGSEIAEENFFEKFLEQLQSALHGDAAAVWLLSTNGMVNRVCEVGFDTLALDQNALASRLNIQYMLDAIQSGEPKVYSFRESGGGESPIDRPLLAVPIRRHEDNVGVVELFLPLDSPAEERLAQLQFVEEACHSAGKYLAWRTELASPHDQIEFWKRFEQFQATLHRSLDSSRIGSHTVNDARQLLGCSRVSVALRRGSKTNIVAISGQESVSQRANVVAGLSMLAAEVILDARTLCYGGSQSDVPPHLEDPLQHYCEQSKSRSLMIVPLLQGNTESSDAAADRPPQAFGALIVENFSADWQTPLTSARAEMVAAHVSMALVNAREYEGIFLRPLRRKLGYCIGLLAGRRLAMAGVIIAVLTCSLFALCVTPATYRVTGEGKLMPVAQRRLFAPFDGEVLAVHVTGGQTVEEGDVLIELRNEEIAAQHVSVRNQHEEKSQRLTALEAALDAAVRSSSRKELVELQGRIAQTRVEIEGLTKRDDILRRQVEQQTIRAPIAGTVAAFQIDQLLRERPVRRGDVLLEVMDKSGSWQLELDVPEHRIGHLTKGHSPETVRDHPVEFALATQPEARYDGTIREVSGRTTLSSDAGAVTKVLVDVDRERIPDRRIGAVVQAKIDCGQSSLAYVLFGDVVEFFQQYLW